MVSGRSRSSAVGRLTLEVAAMVGGVSARKIVLLSRLGTDASKSPQSWTSLSIVMVVIVVIMVVGVSDRASALVYVGVRIEIYWV